MTAGDLLGRRLRLHEAITNFPIEQYAAEVAAAEAEREAGRDAEPADLCQRRREKASRFRGVCLSAGKYVAQITVSVFLCRPLLRCRPSRVHP